MHILFYRRFVEIRRFFLKFAATRTGFDRPGDKIQLDAAGTTDPEGNALAYRWFQYQEAGTSIAAVTINNADNSKADFTIPNTKEGTIHVVLEVKDDGTPALCSYRRVVVTVKP